VYFAELKLWKIFLLLSYVTDSGERETRPFRELSVIFRPYGQKIRPPNCYLPSATLTLNLNLTLTPTLTFTITPTLTLNLTLALSS